MFRFGFLDQNAASRVYIFSSPNNVFIKILKCKRMCARTHVCDIRSGVRLESWGWELVWTEGSEEVVRSYDCECAGVHACDFACPSCCKLTQSMRQCQSKNKIVCLCACKPILPRAHTD